MENPFASLIERRGGQQECEDGGKENRTTCLDSSLALGEAVGLINQCSAEKLDTS